MSQHTPGPWRIAAEIDTGHQGELIRQNSTLDVIAVIYDFTQFDRDEERKANAHLIAAAPELADALRATIKAVEELMTEYVSKKGAANWGIINDAMCQASTLLAKIEGATP